MDGGIHLDVLWLPVAEVIFAVVPVQQLFQYVQTRNVIPNSPTVDFGGMQGQTEAFGGQRQVYIPLLLLLQGSSLSNAMVRGLHSGLGIGQ